MKVCNDKIMPPWIADTSYRSFANDNVLSENELLLLRQWIAGGMKEGTVSAKQKKMGAKKPTVPKPDLILEMPEPYTISGTNLDIFKRFHIPMATDEDIYVSAFRFVPG